MPAEHSNSERIIVLKIGGSILAREKDIARAVHECYRWVRDGWRVVAVVSAIGDTTDRLVAAANEYGSTRSAHAAAALIATGEATSAAHLWLGCDRAGIDAVALDPRDIALRVDGSAADAEPVGVDAARLAEAVQEHDVVVVPGFYGVDRCGRVALLGRGGSDLSAVLLADALGARCRLLKDVPGLFERDPSRPGPFARRFSTITFDDAEAISGVILQAKALAFARSRGRAFEVAALFEAEATLVGAARTAFADDDGFGTSARPTRVGLLGFGVVGRGVWEHIRASGPAFEAIGVAVRSPKRHSDAIHPRLLVVDPVALASDERVDLLIETLGGIEPARTAIEAALRRGAHVVTANKALIARCGEELLALARAHGARLTFSAAVGGAAPLLEAVARLESRGIRGLEGVLNGTTNHIVAAVAAGASFEDALSEAQALGFAETDPTADLSGSDAGDKLLLLCRAAFGVEPATFDVGGINARDEFTTETRLVARARRDGSDGAVHASVRLERLPAGHPLLEAPGEWNALRVEMEDGSTRVARGKGAGRWPTAESVFADVLECCSVPRVTRSRRSQNCVAVGGVA